MLHDLLGPVEDPIAHPIEAMISGFILECIVYPVIMIFVGIIFLRPITFLLSGSGVPSWIAGTIEILVYISIIGAIVYFYYRAKAKRREAIKEQLRAKENEKEREMEDILKGMEDKK
ncbi:MAG: hypothetical protein ACMUHB_01685 [Thermoplasmatota archaeon]